MLKKEQILDILRKIPSGILLEGGEIYMPAGSFDCPCNLIISRHGETLTVTAGKEYRFRTADIGNLN